MQGLDGVAARHKLDWVQCGALCVDGDKHNGARGPNVSGPILLGFVLRDARGARDAIPEVQRHPGHAALCGTVHHAQGELHGVSLPPKVGGGCLFLKPHRLRVIPPLSSLSGLPTLM